MRDGQVNIRVSNTQTSVSMHACPKVMPQLFLEDKYSKNSSKEKIKSKGGKVNSENNNFSVPLTKLQPSNTFHGIRQYFISGPTVQYSGTTSSRQVSNYHQIKSFEVINNSNSKVYQSNSRITECI